MIYILNENDQEPAMRYEGLARHAFNCDRGGGPNNIADAGVFDSEFIPSITKDGLLIMNQIIEALIYKANNEIAKELREIKSSLSEKIEQENGIELIDYIIKIIKE